MALSELRAANVDRERVVERLNRAHAEGRLDLLELDERLAAAYAARTYGDLEPLTVDLPAQRDVRAQTGPSTTPRSAPAPRWARGYALALRIEGASWLFASLVNLAIWVMVSLGTRESVYPWWIWVAGPWGFVLLARIVGEGLRRRSRVRFSTRC